MAWWQLLLALLLGHGSGLLAGMRYRPSLVAKVVQAVRLADEAERKLTTGPDPEAGYDTLDIARGLCGRLEPAGWHCHLPSPHPGPCVLSPHIRPSQTAPKRGLSPC